MSVQLNFDSAGITPNSGNPPPIPLAEYNVMISDSSKQATSSNDGSEYLQFDLKIIDGPLAGRVQVDRMNLWNKNEKTVEIAKERLAAYCHLTGKYKVGNTQEFHGIPFRAIIGPQLEKDGPDKGKPSDKYSEVKELKTTTGERPGKGGAATPAATGAPQFGAPAVAAPPAASAPQFGPPVLQTGFTPAAPGAPAAPPAPPAVQVDPLTKALADGWIQHPDSATHAYKGSEVKTHDEVRALYAAQTAPAVAAAPAFGAPQVGAATGGANPPWTVQS